MPVRYPTGGESHLHRADTPGCIATSAAAGAQMLLQRAERLVDQMLGAVESERRALVCGGEPPDRGRAKHVQESAGARRDPRLVIGDGG
jgi:hypothetical protein